MEKLFIKMWGKSNVLVNVVFTNARGLFFLAMSGMGDIKNYGYSMG